jgi:hypothetical protein
MTNQPRRMTMKEALGPAAKDTIGQWYQHSADPSQGPPGPEGPQGPPGPAGPPGPPGTSEPVTATGSTTPRLLADRFAEAFNIEDYASGDDLSVDATAAFQRTIDQALASLAPRRRILIPGNARAYNFPAGHAALDPGVGGIDFVGAGAEATIIKWHEGTGATATPLFKNVANTAKGGLRFEGIQFRGTMADRPGAGYWGTGNAMWLDYYEYFEIADCAFKEVLAIAMDPHYCGRFSCINSRFKDIAADCIRCRDTSDILATGNRILRNGDDAIAFHTNDTTLATQNPIRERIVIANNHVTNGGMIKVLGAKKLLITGNILHLPYLNAIQVNTVAPEGDNPQHDIVITDNIFTDVQRADGSGLSPNGYILLQTIAARGAAATHSAIPGQYDATDVTIIKNWDWLQSDGTNSAYAIPPTDGILIANNRGSRTLPTTSLFSNYGYGTKLVHEVSHDVAMTDAIMRAAAAINFGTVASWSNVLVSNNLLAHASTGIVLPAPTSDVSYRNVVLRNNLISDILNRGILINSASFRADIFVDGGIIDGDIYRMNANSNFDGSYDANGVPSGIDSGNVEGIRIRGAVIKNVCRMIASNVLPKLMIEDVVGHCGVPAAVGFNVGNKGIGEILLGNSSFRYEIIDADPTSATFGKHLNQMVRYASAAPTTGWYPLGWIVWNITPSGFAQLGWVNIATGSPGTFIPIVTYQQSTTIATDAPFTLVPFSSAPNIKHTGTLTANRAVALATAGAVAGQTVFHIVRTGGGAFTLDIGTGPLKSLATNTWCDVRYDGTAYYLAAYGTL